MSRNIPFEMQVEIMKRLPIRSLIQFRSVSKSWKCLIDSSEFIGDYHVSRDTMHHLLVSYTDYEQKYVSVVDDDNTFPEHKFPLIVPTSIAQLSKPTIVGSSRGLLCLYGYDGKLSYSKSKMAVVWNPTIRKSVDIVVPNVLDSLPYETLVGFGVCPKTNDPILVRVTCICAPWKIDTISSIPWQVHVFTLSSGVWRSPSINLPRKSIAFTWNQVYLDGFIYWCAFDRSHVGGKFQRYDLIMSFDMISEEFTEVYLPDCLAKDSDIVLSISKLKESLVVLEYNFKVERRVYGVWMMEDGAEKLFTKLFTIDIPYASIQDVHGFSKSGKAIIEVRIDRNQRALFVYEPVFKHMGSIGISGKLFSFLTSSYMETLLLLDL
ncbi:putative F-box domain-containing protein [Tanacetum coccineum]|uniref:F-box domain-containing protein n=1 Tax=Tanacetum coccineum TaxID=301880 RepID=A0ABQ5CA41_9ASTR